jgi:hypothetical protein
MMQGSLRLDNISIVGPEQLVFKRRRAEAVT